MARRPLDLAGLHFGTRKAGSTLLALELLEGRLVPWIDLPSGGISLLPDDTPHDDLVLIANRNNAATRSVVQVGALPFSHAVRVEVPEATPNPWQVQLGLDTLGDLVEGDVLLIQVFARGTSSDPEGLSRATGFLQENAPPWTKDARWPFTQERIGNSF